MKKEESKIQSEVRQYLTLKNWYVIRIQQGLGCHKGISDLIALKNGRVIFIEIKTPKGKMSEHQKSFMKDITSHGGEYVIIKSLEEAMSIFN